MYETALLVSGVIGPEDYAAFPSFGADPTLRRWTLWGSIDRGHRLLDYSPERTRCEHGERGA